MFKKHIKNSIIVIIFIVLLSNIAFAQGTIVDSKNLDKGVVSTNYKGNTDNLKVLVTKGKNIEHYDLKDNMNYPLQFGNGNYTVSVLQQVKGNQYRQLSKQIVKLKLKDEKVQFLQPTFMMNWDKDMAPIKVAKKLTKNAKTDEGKVKIIHNYVTKKIKYDNKKANEIKQGYVPSIEETFESRSGICYDYAVLTGSMLRSLGIPTKLVMGYKSDMKDYHAWNQVYINNKWTTIDTTYDAAYVQKKMPIKMAKNAKQYQIEKVY